MPDDRFEDRLRALAQQLSRSISDVDLDQVADRLGVDRDRVQDAAEVARGWLDGRAPGGDPLFGGSTAPSPSAYEPAHGSLRPDSTRSDGPHPLDLPTDLQGRALSALESGRWTLRPGSGRLTPGDASPTGPATPDDADLTGELRARDWITADGTVTLVGRQALLRWSARASGSGEGPEGDDAHAL